MDESRDVTVNAGHGSIAGMRSRLVRQVERLESVLVQPKRLSLWPLLTGEKVDPDDLDDEIVELLRTLPAVPVPDEVEEEIALVGRLPCGLQQIAEPNDTHEEGD